ncbi:MAG TPA: trigger factor [Patescibacteria group bacterium]|nr:trigger factor [Patescibacteria group bacterium]
MTDTTCWKEMELEIPAETVQAEIAKVAKDLARVARIPGFRPGKAPVTLIRRRFADDIKNEVLQSLVPERLEQALGEARLVPVAQPRVEKVDYNDGGPVKFKARFEVLPEFDLGDYKNLEVEVESAEVTGEDVDRALAEMRERAASFVPVEGRPAQDGDYAVLKMNGIPAGGKGQPIQMDNALCHVGAEETVASFSENLRGASPGDHRRFDVEYPGDYPDAKLAGNNFHFAVEVVAVKERKLPELNDDLAKETGEADTLEELKQKIRQQLEAAREERQNALAKDKIVDLLLGRHAFPVPEAMVEVQMDARLERAVRRLIAQGVDPRSVNVDWVAMRRQQRERAEGDVRAEILLDRIATAEKVEIGEEEFEAELKSAAERSGESVAALRARLTREGAVDTMKSKLRNEKTLDWLYQQAQIRVTPRSQGTEESAKTSRSQS